MKFSFIPGKKTIQLYPIANNYPRNLKLKQSLKSNKTDINLNTMLMWYLYYHYISPSFTTKFYF